MPPAGTGRYGDHDNDSADIVAVLVPAGSVVSLAPMVAGCYGLLSALIILSRLDSVVFIVMLWSLELVVERPASRNDWLIRMYTGLSGAVPLLPYVLSNRYWYHVWMPLSGEAKQLRSHHSFSLETLSAALGPINFPFRYFIVYPFVITLIACVLAVLKFGQWQLYRGNIVVSLSLVLTPFIQLITFSVLSDWPIFPWYLYSLPLAMTGLFLLFFNRCSLPHRSLGKKNYLPLQGPVILLAFLFAGASVAVPAQGRWYLFGKDIEVFSQTHDGTYAMGDCAGTTGYLIRRPLVQLEGLVMDAPFLQKIREQSNLLDVLRSYRVR